MLSIGSNAGATAALSVATDVVKALIGKTKGILSGIKMPIDIIHWYSFNPRGIIRSGSLVANQPVLAKRRLK
jgi:hypothetical protein